MKETAKNKIILIDDADLNDFLIYLESVIHYSKKTVKSYGEDIADFLFFLKEAKVDKQNVSRENVKEYRLQQVLKPLNPSSIQRSLSALRHFYQYLHQYKGYSSNPFEFSVSPKKTKRLPSFLSEHEINELLDSTKKRVDDLRYRDSALLELMYATGMRCQETIDLKISDIDFSERTLRIKGKGGKERIVPFSKTAKKAVEDYLAHSRNILLGKNEDTGHLFLTNRGTSISPRGLEKIVEECAKKVGFTLKVHPHMIRHTFATELLNNGADLRTIQEFLGHSSIQTTAIYTHVTYKDLKETYEKCFPREILKLDLEPEQNTSDGKEKEVK